MSIDLALIGGTGLYRFPGLENIVEQVVETPWGKPSDVIVSGQLGAKRVAFLARHGRKHDILPHKVNYRANLQALQQIGARRIIGVNAVGGIREDMGPRVLAIPDQIVDYTYGRITSYCDVDGAEVRHVDFSDPYTQTLRQQLIDAAARADVAVVDGGCYGATQGPRLETRAEIARMRRDGCDLVGMTGMPEAVLSRELGVDYACLALVANWAAGCGDEAEISLEEIFANLEKATAQVPPIIAAMLGES
ncbi:MAG TPA: S-methyl-5'-thioinosine phosphorylase [Dokdonella sp.]|uniref:S-methyl-5'-thioinosine phosphorylase n=1 Tax=Dokdonella sp. TaxID=2291710 RepID=UPI002D7E5D58|nr:S-methyl-5'-thioinosine phosphorylase [Dokdonella sp.]HET9032528.1 S-methyl-5'-thioinosine phosphorylase [Dokdonella sp.]